MGAFRSLVNSSITPRAAARFRALVDSLADADCSLTASAARVGRPTQYSYHFTRSRLGYLAKELRELTGDTDVAFVSGVMTLVGINLRTKTFELHDKADRSKRYIGRIADDVIQQAKGATVGDDYQAVIEVTTETDQAVGEDRVRRRLVNLVKVGEPREANNNQRTPLT